MQYHWPGNMREMENFVKRYLILADEDLVLAEMQQLLATTPAPKARAAAAAAGPGSTTANGNGRRPNGDGRDLKSLVRGLKGEVEAEAIAEVLAQAHGVRKEAARMLNISYKALLYKLRLYGLDQPSS